MDRAQHDTTTATVKGLIGVHACCCKAVWHLVRVSKRATVCLCEIVGIPLVRSSSYLYVGIGWLVAHAGDDPGVLLFCLACCDQLLNQCASVGECFDFGGGDSSARNKEKRNISLRGKKEENPHFSSVVAITAVRALSPM